jgi:hypothetical protein
MRIRVDDVPFLAVLLDVHGSGRDQQLVFTTNVGDETIAGPEHCIRVQLDDVTEEPAPYLHMRGGLDARISRNVFYRLAEIAVPGDGESSGQLGVWSDGAFFSLGTPA